MGCEYIHKEIVFKPKFFTTEPLKRLNNQYQFSPLYTFHIQARCQECDAFLANMPHTEMNIKRLNDGMGSVEDEYGCYCSYCGNKCCIGNYIEIDGKNFCKACECNYIGIIKQNK